MVQDRDPYSPPAAELDGGGAEKPGPYHRGLRSVLTWGGAPQSVGLLFCLIGQPLRALSDQTGTFLVLTSAPIFVLALLLALGRTVVIRWRSSDPKYRRGGQIGGLAFFGLWLLTSTLGCGWSLYTFKIH